MISTVTGITPSRLNQNHSVYFISSPQVSHSLPSNANFLRGTERKIETPTVHIRTAIVDAHSYRASILWILDFHNGTQRYGNRCRRKPMGVERFTTGSQPTGKSPSVPGCDDFVDGILRRWPRGVADRRCGHGAADC